MPFMKAADVLAMSNAEWQELRTKMMRDMLDEAEKKGGLPRVRIPGWVTPPQMIITPTPIPDLDEKPAPVEKPVKRMDEMTFADFQKGVDAWWDKRPR